MKEKKKKEKLERKKDLPKEIGQGFFEDEELGLKNEIKSFNPVTQRLDRDFFKEEENVAQKCYEVRCKEKKGEKFWQLLCDKKVEHEITTSQIPEKLAKYLGSVTGFISLLNFYKEQKQNFNLNQFCAKFDQKT